MQRNVWTLAMLAIGIVLIFSTLSSTKWVIESNNQNYRWGLATMEYCGSSSPCYTEDLESSGISAWETFAQTGPSVYYLSFATLLCCAFVLVMSIRLAFAKSSTAMRFAPPLAAAMLAVTTLLVIRFVAYRPTSGMIGWPYSAYLLGALLSVLGLAAATRAPAPTTEAPGAMSAQTVI